MVARHGLTEVYEPPEGTDTVALYVANRHHHQHTVPSPTSPARANLHCPRIIFVHGLFGHAYHTWASKPSKARSKSPKHRSTSPPASPKPDHSPQISFDTKRDKGNQWNDGTGTTVFWPRDLLPSVMDNVRVFTWGYDADIDGFGSASQSTIHQHAGSLLSDIADQREIADPYKRPIAFVVHGLGGIIVKAALNRSVATEGTRLKDIAPSTFGVCFLGTPHRGSSSASLGKVAYQITVAATRRPNTRLLQGLERNSETLEQIGDAFAQTMLKCGRELRIYSFREEKETRKYWIFNTMVSGVLPVAVGSWTDVLGCRRRLSKDWTRP